MVLMTRRQTASIPLAMGSRFYLPPPPVRVHYGLHSTKQCSVCTSFHPNPLLQYTHLPEGRVLNGRIWMRGHALAEIAKRNDKMVHASSTIPSFFDHGVSVVPSRLSFLILPRHRLTADSSAIGVIYLHRLGVKATATANASNHFAA